jgi:hypothetical protein
MNKRRRLCNSCDRTYGHTGAHGNPWNPAPKLTRADADVLNRAGLKLDEWEAKSDAERADLRYRLGIA